MLEPVRGREDGSGMGAGLSAGGRTGKNDNVDGFDGGAGVSVVNGVWHDVATDPPVIPGSYIVATDRGAVFISHWYGPSEWHPYGGKFNGAHGHITHWMPKPKAPERTGGTGK